MSRARFNGGVFLLEGLNSLGTSYYFNWLFFYLKAQYGFTNRENLLVCALDGFIYIPFALIGGRFGQKRGYLNALIFGSIVMICGLSASLFARSPTALISVMCVWTIGMCFTWPNLEALVSDKETPDRLPNTIGQYNVVWAGCSGFAYFTSGALVEAAGWRSIFWFPICLHAAQLALAISLKPAWAKIIRAAASQSGHSLHESHPDGPKFLKIAWIANPFAYIAINATIPLLPDLATRLHLSTKIAGFFCSVWFFARMLTFAFLAVWDGWHYRFRFLIAAYVGMIASFAAVLLLNNVWLVVLAQLAFGWCIGLIYYSSLYYSMHVGDTKGEHGGMHEAAIGTGIFGGPAIGAASLYLFPRWDQSNVFGVAAVLMAGFAILLWMRKRPVQAV